MNRAWLMVAIVITACSAGTTAAPPPTAPHPECAAGIGIGPAVMALTSAQRQRAISLVMADPVVKALSGVHPDPNLIGPWGGTCTAGQPEQLVGVSLVLRLDHAQDASWDETHVTCMDGVAQLVRTRDTWHGVQSLQANVLLKTGAVLWQPPPPVPPPHVIPPSAQPQLTQQTEATLGPRVPLGGPCPTTPSD